MKMRVLVTGGTGYIGSHCCLELLGAGHKLHIIDNLSNSKLETIKKIEKISGNTVGFSKVDIRDRSELDKCFQEFQPEAVLHFSGLKSIEESFCDPLKYYDNNVNGSIVLLQVMEKYSCNKLIFSSSATVYGNPVYLPYDEEHPENPINPYGQTKLQVEKILNDWCNCNRRARVIALRYFNPLGAHPSGELGEDVSIKANNLGPLIALVAIGKKNRLDIFGESYPTRDGTCERDYIHIADLVSAHLKSLEAIDKLSGYHFLNVGTGVATSVKEMILAFEEVSGIKIPIKIVERREGDLAAYFSNPKKAKALINWEARHNLLQMCKDMWNFYQKSIT